MASTGTGAIQLVDEALIEATLVKARSSQRLPYSGAVFAA